MVIPTFARQKGIPVRLYALPIAAFSSLCFSLAIGSSTSALLPLNKVPIIGQTVADTIHGVKDGVVKPVAESVTGILPQPIGSAVQAPVNTLAKAVDPIVGRSSSMVSGQETAKQGTLSTNAPMASTETLNPQQASSNVATQQIAYPLLASASASLNKHTPVLGVATQSLPVRKDKSMTIAIGITLLAMTLLFVGLIAVIIHSNVRLVSTNGNVFARKDLVQTSVLFAGLITIGSIVLYVLLIK